VRMPMQTSERHHVIVSDLGVTEQMLCMPLPRARLWTDDCLGCTRILLLEIALATIPYDATLVFLFSFFFWSPSVFDRYVCLAVPKQYHRKSAD
jgi:hypothetical protein